MGASNALGKLRRSHYSDQLGPQVPDGEVTVMGWVAAVRRHGAITFLTVNDRRGSMQVVAKRNACPDGIFDVISSLKVHSSVAVTGTARPSPRAPGGAELAPSSLRVLAEAVRAAPFEPQAREIRNIDTRLEVRPIDLRRDALRHVFEARGRVMRAVREYFHDADFTEISTPKMIASATEGGAALFPIFYYDRQAFLAQSPQLYKEQLTMSFEKVFEIAPIFRAEPSRTNRHLSEAISIDMEEAFVDYADVMDRIGSILSAATSAVAEYAAKNPAAGIAAPAVPDRIPRHTYDDVISMLQDSDIRVQWGDDLYPQNLRRAGLEGFYFITDWPMAPKPFYVASKQNRPDVSESFDLMYGDLEISSGSTRIGNGEELARRLRGKGMKTASFGHHLDSFGFGMPPHAGCGIGLERLMMALTGTANIRDVTFYPRDADRLTP